MALANESPSSTAAIMATDSTLHHIDLCHRLQQLDQLHREAIDRPGDSHDGIISTMPYPQRATDKDQPPKLPVVSFLQTHREHGGINHNTYKALHHIVMLISAIGKDLHVIVQSDIQFVSILKNMDYNAGCVMQGLDNLKDFLEDRLEVAVDVSLGLPPLTGNGEGETLPQKLQVWQLALSTLHAPTGNETALFELLTIHYNDSVWGDYIDLMRRKPNCPAWGIRPRISGIRTVLGMLRTTCKKADHIVTELDTIFANVPEEGQVEQLADEGPPQLPPLPFQVQSSSAVEEDIGKHPEHSQAKVSISSSGYTIDSTAGVVQPKPCHPTRRKGSSASSVPRMFTGSFSELEKDIYTMELHKVKTPETTQPTTPVIG
ncbi:hypothetical protein Tdes44962_MAKER00350 [Teratosphaeria destructans]|uniref:Uncharacterized protein n=1 Tax=Teratosphaeria destructans TaxID=418781 RepID=A0A9W7SS66_9PEZI|nr:hypothetical protein Tdes44962_MAKER00350 [Teratosphaeria destructans]